LFWFNLELNWLECTMMFTQCLIASKLIGSRSIKINGTGTIIITGIFDVRF
jgi:hypothetical protein